MTLVKVWGLACENNKLTLKVVRVVRFRWYWTAWLFAAWWTNWVTICTVHAESDRSNVIELDSSSRARTRVSR